MLPLLALLLALPALAQDPAGAEGPAEDAEEVPFDPENYPRATLAESLKSEPCRGRQRAFELKDALFSAELAWQGSVRPTPAGRLGMIRRWTAHIGDPEAASKYRGEAAFSEGGRREWIAVPEGLLAAMRLELMPGDRLLLYLVYAGCARGRPVYAVDEYEELPQTDEEAEDTLIRIPSYPRRLG